MRRSPRRLVVLTLIIITITAAGAGVAAQGANASPAAWRDATPQADALVGLELVFAVQPAAGQTPDAETLLGIRAMLQRRLDAMGLTGGIARLRDGRILVRVDAADDPERVAAALAAPTLLEIIDPLGQYIPPGTMVRTTLDGPSSGEAAPAATPAAPGQPADLAYETIISGADFKGAYVTIGSDGATFVVGFELESEAVSRFFEYTSGHLGDPMSIIIDKQVISSPTIRAPIAGEGIIEGVPPDEVPLLVSLLREGIANPLVLVEQRRVPANGVATPAP